MESFGEGIDVPGKSLQLVYIDKVPDVRISLLTNERRTFFEERFGNEFVDYYLAQRTRSLHQKLGRLLRRESDWGAIIVTDSRLKRWKNRTVGQFRELMEPYDIQFTGLDDACRKALDFIQKH
jgi:ATP-dependent DNA helicase DinG